jgi:tRNA(Leu) C34 or U34 (ribose-2'-O)-methylase TrmL
MGTWSDRPPLREPRLGVDIGRVIIDGSAHPDGGDTAFFQGDEATMLATPEVAGSVAAIARLVGVFGGRVWLVSKCGPTVQARTMRWLAGHDFYARTGLRQDQVRFCRRRADKRIHCEELSLTHFVDDHPEVHIAIRGLVAHQYFFGPQPGGVPGYGIHAGDWAEAEALIVGSLAGSELEVHDVQADAAEVPVLEGSRHGADDGEPEPLIDLDG